MKTKKKEKLTKLKKYSDSDNEDEELHDLTHYAGDCIKLMSEVFKILGEQKLKKMVPKILLPIKTNDMKAALVEESMALSKKRICSILNGYDYSSSSESESDVDLKRVKVEPSDDIISLDGISSNDSDIYWNDDVLEINLDSENRYKEPIIKNKQKKKLKKQEKKSKKKQKIKKEKDDSLETINLDPPAQGEEKVLTALELLELQARARAIKSQLALVETSDTPPQEVKEDGNVIEKEKPNDGQFKTKKIRLRRDHLRIGNPKDSETMEVDKNSNAKPQNNLDKIMEIKTKEESPRKRKDSNDSIILESPSHPLIVLSDSDEDIVKSKKDVTKNNEKKNQTALKSEDKLEKNAKKNNENISKNNITENNENILKDKENILETDQDILKNKENVLKQNEQILENNVMNLENNSSQSKNVSDDKINEKDSCENNDEVSENKSNEVELNESSLEKENGNSQIIQHTIALEKEPNENSGENKNQEKIEKQFSNELENVKYDKNESKFSENKSKNTDEQNTDDENLNAPKVTTELDNSSDKNQLEQKEISQINNSVIQKSIKNNSEGNEEDSSKNDKTAEFKEKNLELEEGEIEEDTSDNGSEVEEVNEKIDIIVLDEDHDEKEQDLDKKKINNDKQVEILSVETLSENLHVENFHVDETVEDNSLNNSNEASIDSSNEVEISKKSTKIDNEQDDNDCIVIDSEPELDSDQDEEDKSEQIDENTTWKTRWLKSKRVKDVIKTSKLCNVMKKKIVSKKTVQSKSSTVQVNKILDPEQNIDEGSVEHFKKLAQKKTDETKTENENSNETIEENN